eukprot:TRINITY_DN4078_c2_g1_i1.p1 TRINITY_DN4078_c2_g1~~TRINITY_DN4078_c2_g1_i1.p1  ORF type:complete len:237 (-),score=2.36 TRINITY_DN4078_c2_g1_i1:172-792(-)
MVRFLRDINLGMAVMVGVASGYYIFEPFVRKQELLRRECEVELQAISDVTHEPLERVRHDLQRRSKDTPITSWLFGSKTPGAKTNEAQGLQASGSLLLISCLLTQSRARALNTLLHFQDLYTLTSRPSGCLAQCSRPAGDCRSQALWIARFAGRGSMMHSHGPHLMRFGRRELYVRRESPKSSVDASATAFARYSVCLSLTSPYHA